MQDAALGRTGLPGTLAEEESPPSTDPAASTSGVILKKAHLLQSLASERLPGSISQTHSLDGVLHCNLQVRRDAQKWVSAGFVTSRNAGFRMMLGQGARCENRDDRGWSRRTNISVQSPGQGGHQRIVSRERLFRLVKCTSSSHASSSFASGTIFKKKAYYRRFGAEIAIAWDQEIAHYQIRNKQLPPTRGQLESSHSSSRRLERGPSRALNFGCRQDLPASCLPTSMSTHVPASAANFQPGLLQACVSPYIQHQTPRCGAGPGLCP